MAKRRRDTPAERARALKNPEVVLPPQAPEEERDLRKLTLDVRGRKYPIGNRLTGDCKLELTMDGASTLTIGVVDKDGDLRDALSDELAILVDGARLVLDDITYVLTADSGPTDEVYMLTFQDEVAWRLRIFASYLAKARSRTTRAEFVALLCAEAAAPPRPELKTFIPELADVQAIAKSGNVGGPAAQATAMSGGGQAAASTGTVGYPLSVRGPVITQPNEGTHNLGNWESDNAVDIRVPKGTAVFAVADGTIGPQFGAITGSGDTGRFAGLRLHLVTSGNEWYYAHLSSFQPSVRPGVTVTRGQQIGRSGIANGVPHLHIASKTGDPRTLMGL